MLKKLESLEPEWLRKIEIPNWLVLVVALVFIARIPTFLEPFHDINELSYLIVGQSLLQGKVIYREVFATQAPLIYFIALVSGNIFWMKAATCVAIIASLLFFWKLTQQLFPKRQIMATVATVAFAFLTTIPTFEGNLVSTEIFSLTFVILSFWLLLNIKSGNLNYLLSGLFFSLALLIRPLAIFEIVGFWVYLLLSKKLTKKDLRMILTFKLGLFLPIVIAFFCFYFRESFNQFLDIVIKNSFQIKDSGLFIQALAIVSGSVIVLNHFKKKLTKGFLFSTAWFLASLFSVTFVQKISGQNLLVIIPAVSILIAILLTSIKIDQTLSILPLLLLSIFIIKTNLIYISSFEYYANFLSYVSGKQTKEEYFKYFGDQTFRDFEISEFIANSCDKKSSIFVWGNSPAVYAMSDRSFTTRYFNTKDISSIKLKISTIDSLYKDRPKFVVVTKDSPGFRELNNFLISNYILIKELSGAKIWKSVENISALR